MYLNSNRASELRFLEKIKTKEPEIIVVIYPISIRNAKFKHKTSIIKALFFARNLRLVLVWNLSG